MGLFSKPKKQEQEQFDYGNQQMGDLPPMQNDNQQGYPYQQPMDMQNQGYSTQQIYGMNGQQMPMQQQGMPQMPIPPPKQEPAIDRERIQEVAEAIIDEKWNELLKDINKMIEWKERADSKMIKIEQDIENLKANFESLHTGILGKISEYDQNLNEVGTEIKAMEKVFQKVLPTLTDNVNKLSRITNNMPDSSVRKK